MNWTSIYVWPDGFWCYDYKVYEVQDKSDDFSIQEIPDGFTPEEIESFVERLVSASQL